jgi:hypothetical protein
VEYLQDVAKLLQNATFETAVKDIPGQHSGISLNYFFMLAGVEELIKPDRMIQRYLERVLQRKVEILECQGLLAAAVGELRHEFAHLTPRLLDSLIWERQRGLWRRAVPDRSPVGQPKGASPSAGNTFWGQVREMRRCGSIPKQWRVSDLRPLLFNQFAENAIRTVPANQSMTRDGSQKGDYVKKGSRAEAYRVGRGLFELIDDPGPL